MIDNVVHLLRLEFMQDRYGNCTIAQHAQKGCCPIRTVTAAKGNLVTLLHSCILKQNVELFNLSGHILILQGDTLIVGERIKVPIALDTLRENIHEIRIRFHFKVLKCASPTRNRRHKTTYHLRQNNAPVRHTD